MDLFQQYLLKEAILPAQEIEGILSHFGRQIFKKGEYYLEPGNVLGYMAFIEKGCIVCMKHVLDGKEQVMDLQFEGDFISILEAEYQRDLSIQFLEDSVVRPISSERLQEVCRLFPSVSLYVIHKYQKYLYQATQRWMDLGGLNAEERLTKILEEHPEFFHRVPHYHIASFLGITPQSMSRLRKQISCKV